MSVLEFLKRCCLMTSFVLKLWSFPFPDEARWMWPTTPCSRGRVITPDLPRRHMGTLSPPPTPRLPRPTPATHLVNHMHGQVTLGASTPGTIPTQGNQWHGGGFIAREPRRWARSSDTSQKHWEEGPDFSTPLRCYSNRFACLLNLAFLLHCSIIHTCPPSRAHRVMMVDLLFSAASAQQRGPLRQDVPPSPTPPLRGLRYDTMARGTAGGGYR